LKRITSQVHFLNFCSSRFWWRNSLFLWHGRKCHNFSRSRWYKYEAVRYKW